MYPKLGAIPTPSARQGEVSGADLKEDYADEGQQQNSGICNEFKCRCTLSVIAVSIIFVIGAIAGVGFMYHHFKQGEGEDSQNPLPSKDGVEDGARMKWSGWTPQDLDILKPIFSVDLSRCGENVEEPIPIYLQWMGTGELFHMESGVLFHMVMSPHYSPREFYQYQELENPYLRSTFPEFAKMEDAFEESGIRGGYPFYPFVKLNCEPYFQMAQNYSDGWKVSFGGINAQHKIESVDFSVTFKKLLRFDGKSVERQFFCPADVDGDVDGTSLTQADLVQLREAIGESPRAYKRGSCKRNLLH